MSDDMEKEADGTESWEKYELAPFGAPSIQEPGSHPVFVPLHSEVGVKTASPTFQRFGVDEEAEAGGSGEKAAGTNPRETDSPGPEEAKPIADLEQEAYDKGFAQGERDGFELGEQKGCKVIESIEALLDEMSRSRSDIIRQHEKEILDIIFAIAERVTQVQIGLDSDVVRGSILKALHYAVDRQTVTLRVNRDDLNTVESLKPEIVETYRDLKSIVVSADSSVSRGGCILETPGGDIDCRVGTQLEKISDALQDAFAGQD